MFSGIGLLSGWKWPDIRGLSTFRGDVIHSADWRTGEGESTHWEKTVETWKDKRVAVIGVVSRDVNLNIHHRTVLGMCSRSDFLDPQGSSAMQIVPALQPRVKELVNYVRGKTWVSPPFIQEKMCELAGGEVSNCTLSLLASRGRAVIVISNASTPKTSSPKRTKRNSLKTQNTSNRSGSTWNTN